MKKKLTYLLILLGIILISFIGYNYIKTINIKNNQKEIIKTLKQEYQVLKENYNELKSNGNQNATEKDKVKCEFVNTFSIMYIFNDYKYDLDNTYVAVDIFQQFSPIILRVPNQYINDLVINKYYEFTFYGTSSLNEYEIINIEETNKIGLEQIQETCK